MASHTYNELDVKNLWKKVEASSEGNSWNTWRAMPDKVILSEKEFYIYCFSDEFNRIVEKFGIKNYYFRWADAEMLRVNLNKNPSFVGLFLKNSSNKRLIDALLKSSALNPLEHYFQA